jgi:hypothetical protein
MIHTVPQILNTAQKVGLQLLHHCWQCVSKPLLLFPICLGEVAYTCIEPRLGGYSSRLYD